MKEQETPMPYELLQIRALLLSLFKLVSTSGLVKYIPLNYAMEPLRTVSFYVLTIQR